MARILHVYPKGSIEGSTWTLITKVYEPLTGINSRFTEITAAGVTAEIPMGLLKVSFDLTVEDSDTDQFVHDSLVSDDIRSGPQVETVWGNWIEIAEGIITGLGTGYTVADWYAAWTQSDTSAVRNDARTAMVSNQGRGWFIEPGSVHQHEGVGDPTDE